MHGWDEYAGKSIVLRKFTNLPDYTGVVGFVIAGDHDADFRGLVYKTTLAGSRIYALVHFDTSGSHAPWISRFGRNCDEPAADSAEDNGSDSYVCVAELKK